MIAPPLMRIKYHEKTRSTSLNPPDSLAVLPLTFALLTALHSYDTASMLLAIEPLTLILLTVLPRKHTETVLLIVEVLSFIPLAVGPLRYTVAYDALRGLPFILLFFHSPL